MARELSDIIKELSVVYNPLREATKSAYNKEIPLVEQELSSETAGLEQAKKDSFGDIETRANRRGMFFSGIPLKEQAQYLGRDYLPAVASLKSRYASRKNALFDAMMKTIAGYDAEETTKAMGIRQQEMELDEQRRQFEAQLAAQREAAARASAGGGGFNFGGLGGGGTSGGYGMSKQKNGNFAFVDPYGNPVSAATYAAATGMPFRQLLQTMANQGDAGARAALGFVGDDYGYDPGKIGRNYDLYNALVWGTGKEAKDPGVISPQTAISPLRQVAPGGTSGSPLLRGSGVLRRP